MDKDAQESKSLEFESTDRQPRIYTDGLGYKNRPIVWVLDNDYAAISRFTGKIHGTFEVLRPTNQDLPIFLDEIKSAYISEKPNAYKGCLLCPDLLAHEPVTVFLYTHTSFLKASKGVRRTHFHGFDVPSTFQMEDYGVLPPVEEPSQLSANEENGKTESSISSVSNRLIVRFILILLLLQGFINDQHRDYSIKWHDQSII